MPKVIVSIDGVVIKEVQLTKERTSLGRRPYNDIVIDNLTVSGEHAALQMSGHDVYLEDLNSTNGTFINGKTAKKALLHDGDTVEIGKYKIKFISDAHTENLAPTQHAQLETLGLSGVAAASSALPTGLTPGHADVTEQHARIKVLSGAAAGREMPLTKVVTTVGKPGVAVCAITRRQRHFFVHHVEGAPLPQLNGTPIGATPVALKNGDMIMLAGTQMQFVMD